MPHSPWDYKQREHLAIILLSSFKTSEAYAILREFKRHYGALREEYCAVLALATDTVVENLGTQEELQLPFALLADTRGTMIARYTYWNTQTRTIKPGIVLADRYGALHEQWITERVAELPPVEELLKDLQYMNKLCTP